jgi:hypothetical protein
MISQMDTICSPERHFCFYSLWVWRHSQVFRICHGLLRSFNFCRTV